MIMIYNEIIRQIFATLANAVLIIEQAFPASSIPFCDILAPWFYTPFSFV